MEVDWEGAQEGHTCLLARDKVQATPGAAVVRYGVREEAGTVEQSVEGIGVLLTPADSVFSLERLRRQRRKNLVSCRSLLGIRILQLHTLNWIQVSEWILAA